MIKAYVKFSFVDGSKWFLPIELFVSAVMTVNLFVRINIAYLIKTIKEKMSSKRKK